MPEAVIVSVARSPIGRAVKGSLATCDPTIWRARLSKRCSTRYPHWTPATHDKTLGVESMCVGGGQGMAMVLERLV